MEFLLMCEVFLCPKSQLGQLIVSRTNSNAILYAKREGERRNEMRRGRNENDTISASNYLIPKLHIQFGPRTVVSVAQDGFSALKGSVINLRATSECDLVNVTDDA